MKRFTVKKKSEFTFNERKNVSTLYAYGTENQIKK